MTAYTETEMINGCCANNRACQEWLYTQYAEMFFKVCSRYAKNFHDAEQLTQDGFLKVFQSIKTFKQVGSFEGWMRRIFVNTCLDYLKSKSFKDEQQTEYLGQFSEEPIDFNASRVFSKMILDDLVKMIQSLPPMSKAVFNLYVFDGFTHKEISDCLNIKEGTSQWHVNNARKCLQQKIAEQNLLTEEKIKMYEP